MDKLKNKIQEQIDQLNVDEPNVSTWADIKNNLPAPEDDLLKSCITENKNGLNIEAPDAQSWERINRVITVERQQHVLTIKKRMLYLSAACIIVVVSVGMLQHMKADKTHQNHEVVQVNTLENNKFNDTTNFEISKKDLTLKQLLPDTPKTIKGNGVAIATPGSDKKRKKKSLPPEVLQIQSDYDELISGQLKYTKGLAIYGESAGYFEQFKN
ncbi:MAG: hypothetical protein J7502_19465, partial [Flavisolibacter sp.]|nr:hypothetical protein [Flavisolibacter sp.]